MRSADFAVISKGAGHTKSKITEQTELRPSGLRGQERYRQLCRAEGSIPIFAMDWWLDAVCGPAGWNASVVAKGGQVIAAIPYAGKRKYGLQALTLPPLTQTLGPWIRYPEGQKLTTRLGYEKDVLGELIASLPPFDYFSQNFHYSITNWLPLYWKGFQQTTLYTYVLDDLTDSDKVWAGFRENVRTDVRKARKQVVVRSSEDIEAFFDLHTMTYERQQTPLPYSRDVVRRLDAACAGRTARQIFVAEDALGRTHAALYLVWDANSAYYLMAGANPDLRSSGAGSLLLWEAIRFAATVTRRFDFEGSMNEAIERFFRAFGGKQVAYFRVTGMSPRMKALWFAREFVGTLVGRRSA